MAQLVCRSVQHQWGATLLARDATTTQAKHQVECRLLLDVVVRKGAPVLELLAREYQALLVRRDALLVLDLRLHVLDRVRALDLQGDGLARQGLHEDLMPPRRRSTRWRVESFWML